MSTTTATVTGMTCSCCVNSVSKEVGKIPGVTGVDVDLATGLVTIESAGSVERDAIAAAIDTVGYELAD